MAELRNIYDKATLRKKLAQESFKRTTLSFYRYVLIENPSLMRVQLYEQMQSLNILGRVYLAAEGINAQISVPTDQLTALRKILDESTHFNGVPFKYAVEEPADSFLKLIVRIRAKIVADGLKEGEVDLANTGKHLTAAEWNKAMEDSNTIVVDMRNHYESEVGHFANALTPDVDTFRQSLPLVKELLAEKHNKKILLYCTGGIRCEKASAYFKHHGYEDVNQLEGGIIDYVRQVQELGLENKFIGKNFVFDDRLGERVTTEIIAKCHQCGNPCDTHTNCANDDCHLLFIQCTDCKEKMNGCCTENCKEIVSLPIEKQRALRKGKVKNDAHAVFKSRLRPKLKLE